MNLAHFPHSIGVISAVEYNTVANLLPGRPVQSHKYSWRILPFFPFVTGSHLLNCGVLFKSRGQICDWVDHTENQVFSVRHQSTTAIVLFYTTLITEGLHFFAFLQIFHYWRDTFLSNTTFVFLCEMWPVWGRRFILILMTMTHSFPRLKTGRWNFTVRLTQSQLGLNLVASGGNRSDHVLIKEGNLHLGFAPAAFSSLSLSFSARVKTVLQLLVTHLPTAPEEENRRSRRKGAGRR